MNTENHYQETDLGNISLNPRGEYNPEESYEHLDLVVLKGGSYVCLAENGATITGISPESGKTTQYWQVITIPGSLTPEYIAMHDRVKNLSEQVDADAEEVRTSLQEVSEIEINVSNLQEQTRQSAEAAEQSKDSSAGYAASADASRQAAEESKQNIDVQVTGFDSHVAEKTEEAENDIEAARIAANKAIIAQQEQSVNEVARAGIEAISTAQSAAQTATEKAQAADTSEKNAAASETAAKLSEENATKMAEQVATDKEQVAYDRTAVENAKQEMTGSVAQIEQNTHGISELKTDLAQITEDYEKPYTIVKTLNGTIGFMGEDENIYPSSSGMLAYSEKVLVSEGDVITSNGNNNMLRFVTAFNANDVNLPELGGNSVFEYTVPVGVSKIVVSLYLDTPNDLSSMPTINITYDVREKRVITDKTLTDENLPANAKIVGDALKKLNNNVVSRRYKGSLSSGQEIILEENHVKNNKILSLSGVISNFGSVEIGHGKLVSSGAYISVDANKIWLFNGTNATPKEITHGLDIHDDIQIVIKTGYSEDVKIKVCSQGSVFETDEYWLGCNGNIFVKSANGTVLSSCDISWISKDLTCDTYAFGDSYFSYYNQRWVYYLLQDGYTDTCLLDGYAGRDSNGAKISFDNLIAYNKPKRVLWCLGMNDGDGVDSINASWLNVYNHVKLVCETYGIELILATIPCTIQVNNSFKNEVVRNSGHRYIDFAKAVNGESVGSTWYEGMCADGVHPTIKGAIALYNQVLADFPEITVRH